jgi:hypothetical protein
MKFSILRGGIDSDGINSAVQQSKKQNVEVRYSREVPFRFPALVDSGTRLGKPI